MADTPAPPEPQALTDLDLLPLLRAMESAALGAEGSELQSDRETANEYYLGKAVGRLAPPAEPDRTAVVDRTLMEAVEWTLPELLRIFIAGEPVEFVPLSPGDEKAARQETAIVNHVITQRNNGYLILRTWFQDALVERNGYVTAYWDEQVEERIEEYHSLAPAQIAALQISIAVRGEKVEELVREEDEQTGLIHLRLSVTSPRSYVHIENIPPERMRVSEDARFSLQDATYVARVETPTRDELIGWGFDQDLVYGLPSDSGSTQNDGPEIARNVSTDESTGSTVPATDPSRERIRVVKAHARVDANGDGRAELLEVWYTNDQILHQEEATCVPYAFITPIPRPHRHVGLSLYDQTADLQEIQTLLSRQLLDNIFISNHMETAVRAGGIYDIDDFMVRRPGGLVRTVGPPAQDLMVIEPPELAHRIIPVIQHYDDRREIRTGIGRTSQGLDSEVLQKGTAQAYQQGLAASSAMREGIARTFAETGFKDLCLLIHRLLIEHQDHKQQVLMGQEWVPVDPRQWRTRSQMVVKVGLGHHTRQEEVTALTLIGQVQQQMMAGSLPAALPNNIYNTAEDLVRALGFPFRAGRYFTDPATVPPSPPQENPVVTATKIEQRGKAVIEAAKLQSEEKQQVRDLTIELIKLQAEFGQEKLMAALDDAARQADNTLAVSERIATQEHSQREGQAARDHQSQEGEAGRQSAERTAKAKAKAKPKAGGKK